MTRNDKKCWLNGVKEGQAHLNANDMMMTHDTSCQLWTFFFRPHLAMKATPPAVLRAWHHGSDPVGLRHHCRRPLLQWSCGGEGHRDWRAAAPAPAPGPTSGSKSCCLSAIHCKDWKTPILSILYPGSQYLPTTKTLSSFGCECGHTQVKLHRRLTFQSHSPQLDNMPFLLLHSFSEACASPKKKCNLTFKPCTPPCNGDMRRSGQTHRDCSDMMEAASVSGGDAGVEKTPRSCQAKGLQHQWNREILRVDWCWQWHRETIGP